MYKITQKYTDFNGTEREEDFLFNLTEAEVAEMELGVDGGMSGMLTKIVAAKDISALIKIFKDLVLKAYGEKSPDGKHFMKNDSIRAEFESTQAYSDIFMSLAQNDELAAEFINKVLPNKKQ